MHPHAEEFELRAQLADSSDTKSYTYHMETQDRATCHKETNYWWHAVRRGKELLQRVHTQLFFFCIEALTSAYVKDTLKPTIEHEAL